MKEALHFRETDTVKNVQNEFSQAYPYLRLIFYKDKLTNTAELQEAPPGILLKNVGLWAQGTLVLHESMTVAELEDTLCNLYGLHAQVFRQAGTLWLQTTVTDSWTLKHQNEQGRDLTEAALKGHEPGRTVE